MGLLKAIKYSTFEASALNEIVDVYESEMNISGIDFTGFCTELIGQTWPEKRLNGLLWVVGHCESHKNIKNIWMNFPQWFRL